MTNYVQKVLIGDGTNNATAATTGTHISAAGIVAGDLLVLDADMKVVDETTVVAVTAKTDKIYIAQGTGTGTFKLSSPIQKGTVRSYKAKIWETPVQQVTYIGYNGTDGDIGTISNSTSYLTRIIFKDEQRLIANRQTALTVPVGTDATATKTEYITSFIKFVNASKYSTLVQAERVSNGVLTELAADTTVTFGSTAVASAGHGLTAGGLVSLRGITYVVASATTNAFVLDTPYLGASETIVVASTVSMAASQATPTLFGIKLTGKAIPTQEPDKYEMVSFDVALPAGFDTSVTQVRVATKATRGSGLPVQVKELEFQQSTISNRRLWPIPTITYYTNTALAGYDLVVIEHADVHQGDFQGRYSAPVGTILAIPANVTGTTRSAQAATAQGAPANTGTDATVAILNAWMAAKGSAIAVTL